METMEEESMDELLFASVDLKGRVGVNDSNAFTSYICAI